MMQEKTLVFASLKTGIKKQSMRMAVGRKVLSVEFSVLLQEKSQSNYYVPYPS